MSWMRSSLRGHRCVHDSVTRMYLVHLQNRDERTHRWKASLPSARRARVLLHPLPSTNSSHKAPPVPRSSGRSGHPPRHQDACKNTRLRWTGLAVALRARAILHDCLSATPNRR
ncbi:hypothetical protein C8Q80DRAFT_1187012 [Daedaleopsis nitida]|nr:hypothetical protein C8Q80DRAFT_1187012 [Daedaleopsis nitida]